MASFELHLTVASDETSPTPSSLMGLMATAGGAARGLGVQELVIEKNFLASSGGLEGREVPVER